MAEVYMKAGKDTIYSGYCITEKNGVEVIELNNKEVSREWLERRYENLKQKLSTHKGTDIKAFVRLPIILYHQVQEQARTLQADLATISFSGTDPQAVLQAKKEGSKNFSFEEFIEINFWRERTAA